MRITIEPPTDPTEAKTHLMFFTVALGTGFTASLLATIFQQSQRLQFVATLLLLMVGITFFMILGTAVFVAREPSLRRLTLAGLVTLIAPWLLALLVQVCAFAAGHDAGGFSLMYYMLSCTLAGLGLLATACVRFMRERRKPQSF